MDEYTVGSLADLISGSNTPNKVKIIEKKLKKKIKNEVVEEHPPELIDSEINPEGDGFALGSDISKSKKRKHEDDEDGQEFVPKKKKNRKERIINANMPSEDAQQEVEVMKKSLPPEEAARTIYVGNIPLTIKRKRISSHFNKYGKIESVRIRGVPPADLNTSKKVAAIKKEFHPKRTTAFCYIKFKNKEDALKALVENGNVFEDHHLRVDSCAAEEKLDESKAIFVGNLRFDAEEEELWDLFKQCGPIESVRIIRDFRTRMGKGFGYVNFKNSDSVQLALGMDEVKFKDRELRIKHCNVKAGKKNKKSYNKIMITKAGKPQLYRRKLKGADTEKGIKKEKKKSVERNAEFQGSKVGDNKKKRKIDKGMLQKKLKIKKIAPKQAS